MLPPFSHELSFRSHIPHMLRRSHNFLQTFEVPHLFNGELVQKFLWQNRDEDSLLGRGVVRQPLEDNHTNCDM